MPKRKVRNSRQNSGKYYFLHLTEQITFNKRKFKKPRFYAKFIYLMINFVLKLYYKRKVSKVQM